MTTPLPPLLLRGDCLVELRRIPDGSIDSVVCDPPYGLEFMGKAWDKYAPLDFELWCAKWAAECLRILKPGGHLLAFGGSRTWHRLAAGIEDAGFEIRDSIAWLYGSGFPKSMDVSKAIDKRRDDSTRVAAVCRWLNAERVKAGVTHAQIREALGLDSPGSVVSILSDNAKSHPRCPTLDQWEVLRVLIGFGGEMDAEVTALNGRKGSHGEAWESREITGAAGAMWDQWEMRLRGHSTAPNGRTGERRDIPAADAAREWEGWGTALKPAFEPVVVARKPLGEKTVAANVLAHGTGALNIDATRVPMSEADAEVINSMRGFGRAGAVYDKANAVAHFLQGTPVRTGAKAHQAGRWPANVALDESQAAALDEQSGTTKSKRVTGRRTGKADATSYGTFAGQGEVTMGHDDSGGASRFFYVAKAPKSERPVYWRPSCNCETIKPCAEPSPQRATDESRSTDDKSWSTSTSGKKRKGGKSHRATTSTTETATSSTTSGGTFNSSRNSSTSESIQAAKSGAANGGSPAESAASSSPSPSSTGTSLPKGGPSTVAADPAILSEWSETSVCANCGAPARRESHATVKPLALMRWLIRLVTPPGGVVVDPFAGSGTTLEAAYLEGFESIGVEMTPEYWPLVAARIERVTR